MYFLVLLLYFHSGIDLYICLQSYMSTNIFEFVQIDIAILNISFLLAHTRSQLQGVPLKLPPLKYKIPV